MIASIPISLLLLGGVFSGVRSKVERTGPPQPARAKNCEILFIDGEESNRQYEVLGRIHIWITRNKITRETGTKVETAQPEFRKQACKLGADAVMINSKTISHSGEFKLLYLRGEAVRFTDQQVAPNAEADISRN